jgi:hypothetical protein
MVVCKSLDVRSIINYASVHISVHRLMITTTSVHRSASRPPQGYKWCICRGGFLPAPTVPSIGAGVVFSHSYSGVCKGSW